MMFSYSEIIERFKDVLGTPKELIEETFNKPDATDVVKIIYISIKKFYDSYTLITFEMDDKIVRFLNAYKIYPKLLDGMDISKTKPVDVLREFMNRYGVSKDVPGLGEQKFLIDRKSNIYFFGVLDIDKYQEAAKSV